MKQLIVADIFVVVHTDMLHAVRNNPTASPDARQGEIAAYLLKEMRTKETALTYINDDHRKGLADHIAANAKKSADAAKLRAPSTPPRATIFYLLDGTTQKALGKVLKVSIRRTGIRREDIFGRVSPSVQDDRPPLSRVSTPRVGVAPPDTNAGGYLQIAGRSSSLAPDRLPPRSALPTSHRPVRAPSLLSQLPQRRFDQ